MTSLIVPEWYLKARQEGASKEELKKQVEAFCLKAIKRRAARLGESEPDQVEPEVVTITFDMYEFAIQNDENVE